MGLARMFEPVDGNDRNRDRDARDAAPVRGSYICDEGAPGCPDAVDYVTGGVIPVEQRHCYHESTRRRLEWQYGHSNANAADIARWNALGTRKAVAA